MYSRRVKWLLGGLAVLAALLLLFGLGGLLVAPTFIDRQVVKTDQLGLVDGPNGTRIPSDVTRKWMYPPYDMRLHVWLYSVTNEAAYLAGKEKIHLKEKGPYVFVEAQSKRDPSFSTDGLRVIYRNTHQYFFNQSLSCKECRLTDQITIPNIIFQKLVDFAESSIAAKMAIESVLLLEKRETPFVTLTVGDALFEGYVDPILSKVCAFPVVSILCRAAKVPDRIGFFYGQNNTNDGAYEVGTGMSGPQDLGKMFAFNNSTTLPLTFWESPYARMINGTDGQLFPPMLDKSKELTVFASQACRSVRMAYQADSEYQGVSSWRYAPPSSMYDPAQPANQIFCHFNDTVSYFDDPKVQLPGCLPSGMLDLSHCQPGNPRVYLSQAHFLQSPKEVWQAVGGLSEPSEDNDSTYVDIEPTSGIPIWAKRVMQVNVGMKKGNLGVLDKTANVIVPVFWVNETASFDEETRAQLKDQLQAAKRAAFYGGLSSLCVGIAVAVGVVLAILVEWAFVAQGEGHERLISETDEEGEYNVQEEEAGRDE